MLSATEKQIHADAVLEQRLGMAWKTLEELKVVKKGHYRRHDPRHTCWYYDTRPAFVRGAIWSLLQDLASIIDPAVLENLDYVVGPQRRGDVMAHGLANIITSSGPMRPMVGCIPIEQNFRLVT